MVHHDEKNIPTKLLLFLSLDGVSRGDEDAACLTLHFNDDFGQSAFANLFKDGQFAGAEHNLEGGKLVLGASGCSFISRGNATLQVTLRSVSPTIRHKD